jgi:hypothetical protein
MQIVIFSLIMLLAPMLEGLPLISSSLASGVNKSKWDGPWLTPLVAIAAANMGDDKIVMWSSSQIANIDTGKMWTYYAIYDPASEPSFASNAYRHPCGHVLFFHHKSCGWNPDGVRGDHSGCYNRI